jgi:hypothetical protein
MHGPLITIPNTHGIRTVSAPSVRVGEHSVLEATTRTLHATKCLRPGLWSIRLETAPLSENTVGENAVDLSTGDLATAVLP